MNDLISCSRRSTASSPRSRAYHALGRKRRISGCSRDRSLCRRDTCALDSFVSLVRAWSAGSRRTAGTTAPPRVPLSMLPRGSRGCGGHARVVSGRALLTPARRSLPWAETSAPAESAPRHGEQDRELGRCWRCGCGGSRPCTTCGAGDRLAFALGEAALGTLLTSASPAQHDRRAGVVPDREVAPSAHNCLLG